MRKWLFGLSLLLLLSLPTLLSYIGGGAICEQMIASKVGMRPTIQSLRFSWHGPQKLQGIHWNDPEMDGHLTIHAPLWKLFQSAPFEFIFSSNHIQTHMRGVWSHGTVTLQEPLTAHIQLTAKLCKEWLKDANPLFFSAIDAKSPITLQLQEGSFSLPFSLKNLQAKGTLDMGQVECRSGKYLTAVIHLLKGTPTSTFHAWFSPLSFHLQDGVVHTGRVDALLADSIHVCSWGHIDIANDQIHMFLGIPAATLKKSFGIRHLPKNLVLPIPIRGSTRHPEMIKNPTLAKIAALVSGDQISKHGFLGQLPELFLEMQSKESIPEPMRPYPWEHS